MKTTLPRMTPSHPKWKVFFADLEGPRGCDFRKNDAGKFTWKCDSTIKRSICRRLLKKHGAAVEESLKFFAEHDGYCDCEVVFNVRRSIRQRGARVRVRLPRERGAVQIGNGNRMVVKRRRKNAP
jgi:hypothetical protein